MSPVLRIALTVALGGFLMGFDASVISGVVSAVEQEFTLGKLGLGWVVASLTLSATLAMLMSGPLADRFGRRPVLQAAAALFAVSAVACAFAPDAATLVAARMVGGLGVGAALIVAPLYIAEIAPPEQRGRLVCCNQLNIVLGISAAYFSNYLLARLALGDGAWVAAIGLDEWTWRWMLGIEALPAVIYGLALMTVPESPRWLLMRDRLDTARRVLQTGRTPEAADREVAEIQASLARQAGRARPRFRDLVDPRLRPVLVIALVIAVLQQATGINAVFFYAPMIFELSGLGENAALLQAVMVGLVNLVFTVVAIRLIDRAGRRPLMLAGLLGVTLSMGILAWGFGTATWVLGEAALRGLDSGPALASLVGQVFTSDVAFRDALTLALGPAADAGLVGDLARESIRIDSRLVLLGILGFVASFGVSLGPVMWVLLSELFPNRLRALAISFVGLVNSAVSFGVQYVFPWELDRLGAAFTFGLFAVIAAIGFIAVHRGLRETRGRSLEDLESMLLADPAQRA